MVSGFGFRVYKDAKANLKLATRKPKTKIHQRDHRHGGRLRLQVCHRVKQE